MITIQANGLTPTVLIRFVLESDLAYPTLDGQDGRLACWLAGEGAWAVAYLDGRPVGIACLVTLDDGPYAGARCLYWLEVLPPFRGQRIGTALLRWAEGQVVGCSLLIKAVPTAVPFYRRCLASQAHEPEPNTFVVCPLSRGRGKGGEIVRGDIRSAA